MAATANVIRVQRTLHITVGEARNLKAVDKGGTSDPFCLVNAGSGIYFRTPTIWKNVNPFWGESTVLNVSETFDKVQLSVYDDAPNGKVTHLGQVAVTKANLNDRRSHEQWYPLFPEDTSAETFVSGDLHLRLLFEPDKQKLTAYVMAGRNLASKDANGFSDPYVKLYFGAVKFKSQVHLKTLEPEFNETFVFENVKPETRTLYVAVWDYDRMSKNDFMGQVQIPMDDLQAGVWHDSWYDLSPRFYTVDEGSGGHQTLAEEDEQYEDTEDHGAIRLKLAYFEDKILPVAQYSALQKYVTDQRFALVRYLATVTREREAVARSLLMVFCGQGGLEAATVLCQDLVIREIDASEASTIFRGNSLATKVVDQFMKLCGMEYLTSVLKPIIDEVANSKIDYEVDPTRVENAAKLPNHWSALVAVMETLVSRVFQSYDNCPLHMRKVFNCIRVSVEAKFPNDDGIKYTAVNGFLFLRFICPAILGPKLFGLMSTHPENEKSRAFTLIAKSLQNLANLVPFGEKEPFMLQMNAFINSNMPALRTFCDNICALPTFGEVVPRVEVDVARELSTMQGHLMRDLPSMQEQAKTDNETKVCETVKGLLDTLAAAENAVATAPAAGAAAADDDAERRAQFQRVDRLRTMLSRGGTFLKYAKSGKPHDRFVYCVLSERKVYWKEPESGKKPTKQEKDHCIPFPEITQITKGHMTEVFTKRGEALRSAKAFSIVSEARTLDLECPTEAIRDDWYEAFQFLKEWQGAKAVAARSQSMSSPATPTAAATPTTSASTPNATAAVTPSTSAAAVAPGTPGTPGKQRARLDIDVMEMTADHMDEVVRAAMRSFVIRWRVKTIVRVEARKRQQQMIDDMKRERQRAAAASRIQSFWRGYKVRCFFLANGIKAFKCFAPSQPPAEGLPSTCTYWDDPYDQESLIDVVKAMKLPMLVDRLTHPTRKDPDLTDLFLLTHSLYAPTLNLLKYLEARFNAVPAHSAMLEEFQRNNQTPMQLRVMAFVEAWMRSYFYDFHDDSAASREITRLLGLWCEDRSPVLQRRAREIRDLYMALRSEPDKRFMPDFDKFAKLRGNIPNPILPRGRIKDITDLHPVEVARQLTLLDYGIFFQIREKEYLKQSWAKHGKELRSPNLMAMIDRFNAVTNWAQEQILKYEDIEERANVVCILIDVMDACLTLSNYSSLMAILSAFSAAAVTRLKFTFDLLPEEYEGKLQALQKIMSIESNYSVYRRHIKKASPPIVPYIGVFLQDLTFIDDGNQDKVGRMINLEKHQMTAEVIYMMDSFRTGEYCLHPVSTIADYLRTPTRLSEKELYAKSLEREPRGSKPLKTRRIIHEPFQPFQKPEFDEALNADFLKAIQVDMTSEDYQAGATIIRMGDPGSCMYFISKGLVQVTLPKGQQFQLTEGDFFGEMALFLNTPRAANIKAHTDCSLRVLTKSALTRVLELFPEVKADFTRLAQERADSNNTSTGKSALPKWMKQLAKKQTK